MGDIVIAGYVPGAIGRVAELHARYYSAHWGFGLFFEAQVAAKLAEFLQRFNPEHDGFWTVSRGGRVLGALAIDGMTAAHGGQVSSDVQSGAHNGEQNGEPNGAQDAHLRWFILAEELRGQGVGDRLMREAVDFCRRCGHPSVFLWTFQGLDAARHLYEKHGFRLAEEREGSQWGTVVLEQRFVLPLG